MTRTDIINQLIKKHKYKSYLEIGVCDGHNLRAIQLDNKIGVDPAPMEIGKSATTHIMESDTFFAQNNDKFDIIFVDGLHHADQVYKDIINSLEVLNDGGTIVCHDMNPPTFACQLVPRVQKVWTGDCWKAWVKLRTEREDLKMFVVNTDWGCGIITKGKQKKLSIKEKIDYKGLEKNRVEWLNLIDVEDFSK